MTRRSRRNHSASFKAKVALAALKGATPTVQCNRSQRRIDGDSRADRREPFVGHGGARGRRSGSVDTGGSSDV